MWLLWIGLAWSQGVPDAVQTLPTAGVFSLGKPGLTAEGHELVLRWLSLLEAAPEAEFEVSAHTNSQGSDTHNQHLSQLRAEAVVEALVAGGADPHRLQARGYGEAVPIASNQTPEGRAANARLELRRLDGGPQVPPTTSYSGPETWIGMREELRGVFGSGDETREGPLQVDRVSFEVPFTGAVRTRSYSNAEAPTFRLVGPSGASIAVPLGRGVVELEKGSWVVEAREGKKSKGGWAVNLTGVSPEPPSLDAPRCAVLSYLAAEVLNELEGAAGPRIDDHFVQARGVPGIDGVAKIQDSLDEYRLVIYDGDDAGAAASAWKTAEEGLTGCWRSPEWSRSETPWVQMESGLLNYTWKERFVEFLQSGPFPVVGKLTQEERPGGSTTVQLTLRLRD